MEPWDIREAGIPIRSSNNVMFTQGLFYEFGSKDAVYTLKNEDVTKDGVKYLSIYRLYMESVDEYEAAMKIVGSMQHWRKLCSLAWFMDGMDVHSWEGLKQAREDMAARDKSLAKQQIAEAAKAGNVAAMRTLYGEVSKPVSKPKKQSDKRTDDVTKSIVADIAKIREAR
jgi:hypothetical protein